jgi:hypothetical protein
MDCELAFQEAMASILIQSPTDWASCIYIHPPPLDIHLQWKTDMEARLEIEMCTGNQTFSLESCMLQLHADELITSKKKKEKSDQVLQKDGR